MRRAPSMRLSSHSSMTYSIQPLAELREPPAPNGTGRGNVSSCQRLDGFRRLSMVLSEHESFFARSFLRRTRLERVDRGAMPPVSVFGEWVVWVEQS